MLSSACASQSVPGGQAPEALQRADRAWRELCDSEVEAPPTVIRETPAPMPPCASSYDVVILGGALASPPARSHYLLCLARGQCRKTVHSVNALAVACASRVRSVAWATAEILCLHVDKVSRCSGQQRRGSKLCKHASAGTLGIFHGAALALRGRRVAVVERGRLQGREQEWNISRADMKARPTRCALVWSKRKCAVPLPLSWPWRLAADTSLRAPEGHLCFGERTHIRVSVSSGG